jgi:hypothetical protein
LIQTKNIHGTTVDTDPAPNAFSIINLLDRHSHNLSQCKFERPNHSPSL